MYTYMCIYVCTYHAYLTGFEQRCKDSRSHHVFILEEPVPSPPLLHICTHAVFPRCYADPPPPLPACTPPCHPSSSFPEQQPPTSTLHPPRLTHPPFLEQPPPPLLCQPVSPRPYCLPLRLLCYLWRQTVSLHDGDKQLYSTPLSPSLPAMDCLPPTLPPSLGVPSLRLQTLQLRNEDEAVMQTPPSLSPSQPAMDCRPPPNLLPPSSLM
eukprot:363746-Chlamydomonas_euryale.AAC.3